MHDPYKNKSQEIWVFMYYTICSDFENYFSAKYLNLKKLGKTLMSVVYR